MNIIEAYYAGVRSELYGHTWTVSDDPLIEKAFSAGAKAAKEGTVIPRSPSGVLNFMNIQKQIDNLQ